MKNILVVEPAGKLYGSEMVLWDILKNKKSDDIIYSVALPPNSEFTEELEKIKVKPVEILNINNGALNKIISYFRLLFYVLTHKIDLILINQAGVLRSMAIISFITRTPIVCQVSTLEDCPWLNDLNKFYHNQVKSFICNSKFIGDKLKVSKSKKSILYYGYEWKDINPSIRTETRPFNIVLLGRISISKGHFLLIKAVNLLKNKGLSNFKVFFIGSAPSLEIENEAKFEISNNHLEDYFVFRGFQRNLTKELSDKNLMVIPSINEPFGRIFCETAEAKLPALVANSGGLGELSSFFNLGETFEGGNAEDLASKIEQIMRDYNSVKNVFEFQANEMLRKLDMSSYIGVVETILKRALKNENSSYEWYGKK